MIPIYPNPRVPIPGAARMVVAEHQEGVRPLPALRFPERYLTLTRWHPTDEERIAIAGGGDIFLTVHHEGAMQPLAMSAFPDDLIDGWPDD